MITWLFSFAIIMCFISQVRLGNPRSFHCGPVQSKVSPSLREGAGCSNFVWSGHEPRPKPPTQSTDTTWWVKLKHKHILGLEFILFLSSQLFYRIWAARSKVVAGVDSTTGSGSEPLWSRRAVQPQYSGCSDVSPCSSVLTETVWRLCVTEGSPTKWFS